MNVIEKDTRIPIEIRHVRPKTGKNYRQRVPIFLAIIADRTCDDLRKLVDEYVSRTILAGYADQREQNVVSPAAASAAQLELNVNHHDLDENARNGTSSSSSSSSPYYTLELDTFEHIALPLGPVPIVESLCVRFPLNALVVFIKWAETAAAEYAFRTVEQDAANPDKLVDEDLGLGKIKLDSSCTEKDDVNSNGGVTLQQCLDVFRKREQLGEDDPWFCDGCKTHRCAFKTMDLWDAPRILVIHLKRFLYERVGGVLGERVQREKINDRVQFPMEGFDIGPMLAGKNHSKMPTVYDLFAVSNHMGGLGGGHYTAYVKSGDGSWWLMNDGTCSKVEKKDEETEVVSSHAYVLFYKRRD